MLPLSRSHCAPPSLLESWARMSPFFSVGHFVPVSRTVANVAETQTMLPQFLMSPGRREVPGLWRGALHVSLYLQSPFRIGWQCKLISTSNSPAPRTVNSIGYIWWVTVADMRCGSGPASYAPPRLWGVWISQVDLPNCMCLYRNSSVWWFTPPVSTLQEQRQHQKLEASLDTFSDIFFQNKQKATTGHQHQRKPSSVFVCCQQAEVREIQLCWCWRQRKGFWAKETEKLLEVKKKKVREVGFPPTIPALLMSWV